MLKSKAALLLCGILFLQSCGLEGAEDGIPGSIAPYAILAGDFETATSSQVQGTGTIRMSETLSGFGSSASFHLRMNLLEDDSELTLVAHSPADDLSIGNGIQVRFERIDQNNIEISIYDSNGLRFQAIPSRLIGYRVDRLHLVVDILVDGPRARVIIWRDSVLNFDIVAADIDTDNSATVDRTGLSFYASGFSWGLRLNNAQVYLAQKDQPRLQ